MIPALATAMLLVSQASQRKLEWIAAFSMTMVVYAVGLIFLVLAVEMLLRGLKAAVQQW